MGGWCRHFPGALPVVEARAQAQTAAGIGPLSVVSLLDPARAALAPVTLSGGAGVSFERALIEGTTAYLLDRARADVARAGLELLAERMHESPLRGAFEQTLLLSGFSGEGAARHRDPRLYLQALQASLVNDFEGLPGYVAQRLREEGEVRGLEPIHWELAERSLRLVDDVQGGAHPLLALSGFARRPLTAAPQSGPDAEFQRRLYELGALAGVMYAGSTEVGGAEYRVREVLRSLDGRRVFVHCLLAEPGMGTSGTASSEDVVRQSEARLVSLLVTLDDIVTELDALRDRFDQIQAVNPDQAALVYAEYVGVVTRAVRQVIG